MNVTTHTPKPVNPPKSYDITGLTAQEMFMLRIALLNYEPAVGASVYTYEFAERMHNHIAAGMR